MPQRSHLLGSGPSPQELFSVLVAPDQEGFLFLDWGHAGYSYMGVCPDAVLTLPVAEVGLPDRLPGMLNQVAPPCAEPLVDAMAPPFQGGWVGAVSYAMGHAWDRVRGAKTRTLGFPAAHFAHYAAIACFHHKSGEWILYGESAAVDTLYARMQQAIKTLRDVDSTPTLPLQPLQKVHPLQPFAPLVSAESFTGQCERVREYIRAGDIFQANIAQPLATQTQASPSEIFAEIDAINPSPWASVYQTAEWAIVSNSPELLLSVRGDCAESRPIAGTRPRSADLSEDRKLRRNLMRSPKERAEHIMLVDLLRNDLGRVCQFGSVHVPRLMELEPYANVTHIVSRVQGTMRTTCTSWQALAALFPGGTITGAPKLRSMEIINELELWPRDFYTGSLGWVGHGRNCEWNILIRTLQMLRRAQGWDAWLHVGAGVVADSQPGREYAETLHKAASWMNICKHAI